MLIVVPVVIASLIAWIVGRRFLGLPRLGWTPFVLMLEYLGASAAFFVLDLLVGLGLVVALRSVAHVFISMYVLNGILVVPLALCQGLVFWSWWRLARRCR